VGVGAVVFNDDDKLLLICRRDSGRWLYPTGWLDVDLTPAETAVKQVREETGLRVEATKLLGVVDRGLCGYPLPFDMISTKCPQSPHCCAVQGDREPAVCAGSVA
jgi:8-oxo-dGTP pyrophosphatase MutT (NUDIX family)